MANRSARSSAVIAPLGALLGMLLPACSGPQLAEPAAPDAASVPPAAAPAPSAVAAPEPAKVKVPAISEAPYGTVNGAAVKLYTLRNKNGLVAKITNYGGIITEFHVPDKAGKLADIVLGYDKLDDYVKATPYFGAVIGRVANRIKNAQFSLEGKNYKLAANDGPNTLHGGNVGWDKVVWNAEALETEAGPALKLTYVSKDGDEGYPGTVTVHHVYTLTDANELRVEMTATTDKTTIVNMAHHSYWNLGGHDSGPTTGQELTLFADQYTPGDLVPDGKVKAVKGTPFDFTLAKPIGKDLQAAGGKPVGFDHNWIVRGEPHALRQVARLKDPKSGRVLELSADQPGVQFYSGNFLDGSNKGKGGVVYQQYTGLCLETQKFPNSINVPAWRDEVILKPGVTYKHTMVHRFSVE
ncbi:MAG TPA: aldose epimerase family protein [Polyangiaceae bacterium]